MNSDVSLTQPNNNLANYDSDTNQATNLVSATLENYPDATEVIEDRTRQSKVFWGE